MGKEKQKTGHLIKTILVMYIITGLLLVGLAVLVSKVEKEELVARVGVMAIYVISCMLGGYVLGKWKKAKKFAWGLLAGALYVAILLGIGLGIGRGSFPDGITMATTAAICLGSGMIGGMIS